MPLSDVKMQWVLTEDGQIHHVDDFLGLPPGARPDTVCPICKHPVVLRLGEVRAHHAAHQAADVCPATQPETALHLNVKLYLTRQLQQARQLFAWQKCQGWTVTEEGLSRSGSCGQFRPYRIAQDWDQVAVELSIGSYRPDITLLRGGKALLGIEVVVSHRIEASKKTAFQEAGLHWVELTAHEELYLGEDPWTPDKPLLPDQSALPQEFTAWRCPSCEQALAKAKWQIQKLSQPKPPPSAQADTFESTVRWVDIYYPSGKMFREIFSIVRRTRMDGKMTSMWLERGDYQSGKPTHMATAPAPVEEEARLYLENACRRYLDDLVRRRWLVDSPMNWHPWPQRISRTDVLIHRDWFPSRYIFVHGKWVLNQMYQSLRWDGCWEDRDAYHRQLFLLQHPRASAAQPVSPIPPPPPPKREKPPAVCMLCGQTTTDYWFFDGAGRCKCYACLDLGKG